MIYLFFSDFSILDLPTEILLKILQYVPRESACVSRRFRKLVYQGRTTYNMNVLNVSEHCALKFMRNLKSLKVIAMNDEPIEIIFKCLNMYSFPKLEKLFLMQFKINDCSLQNLVTSISRFNLSTLQIATCTQTCITVGVIEELLDKLPNLKFCIVPIRLYDMKDKMKFAQIANKMSGKINFHLDVLSRIPNNLLWYPWSMYHVRHPTGQLTGDVE